MTRHDLYPCNNCGRESLYPACEDCGQRQASDAHPGEPAISDADLDLDAMFPTTPAPPAARRSRDARVAHTTNLRGW